MTVVLDTNLTEELIEEGFVYEIISKIQTMRKDAGFDGRRRLRGIQGVECERRDRDGQPGENLRNKQSGGGDTCSRSALRPPYSDYFAFQAENSWHRWEYLL